jgi:hypothetical protein
VEKHVVPPVRIINQEVGNAVPEQLMALSLAPGCLWILIVLSESHERHLDRPDTSSSKAE